MRVYSNIEMIAKKTNGDITYYEGTVIVTETWFRVFKRITRRPLVVTIYRICEGIQAVFFADTGERIDGIEIGSALRVWAVKNGMFELLWP